jgi:LysR family carnitine catabolism transcriptional activator
MQRNLSLRQVRGFLLASELRSFNRAAEIMGVSQSSFSQLIRDLEAQLGVRLFDRTTRRILLTNAGETLHPEMVKVAEAVKAVEDEATAIARVERGEFAFGAIASLSIGIVPRALGAMRQAHLGIKPTFQEGLNDDLIDRVANGQIDFAVCSIPGDIPGLSFRPILEEESLLVVPQDHRLASQSEVGLQDLADENFIIAMRATRAQKLIFDAKMLHNVDLRHDYEVVNLFSALSMVKSGFGVTTIPETMGVDIDMRGLVALPFAVRRTRRIGICRQSERTPSPTTRKFEEFLIAEAARTLRQARSGEA